jgi:hypothetical protein
MPSLTERAAKAICDDYGGRPPCFTAADWKQGSLCLARVALAAIRAPTPAMIAAGDKEIVKTGATASRVWRAMHEAMMKE